MSKKKIFFLILGVTFLVLSYSFLKDTFWFFSLFFFGFVFFLLSILLNYKAYFIKIFILENKDIIVKIKNNQIEEAELFIQNVMVYKELYQKIKNEKKRTNLIDSFKKL